MTAYTAILYRHTCEACPSQWEVSSLPKPLYIRYRWGTLTVQEDLGDEVGPFLLEQRHGHSLAGFMTTAAMQQHTSALIDWSKARET